MITDEETLKMKRKILTDIANLYEKLLKANKLTEQEADEILAYVKEKLAPLDKANRFSSAVFDFCKRFPAFKSIEKKVKFARTELLHKVGQECIENLMEDKVEDWEKLIEALQNVDENTLGRWTKELPPDCKIPFFEKVTANNQQTNAI